MKPYVIPPPEASYQFFGILDGLSILVWLLILINLISSDFQKNKNISYYKYYQQGFYFKLFAALIFSIIYIIKYNGGDTTAYWDAAQKLNNLLYERPALFIKEFFSNDPERLRFMSFDDFIGLPPNWIYKEDESWFTSKVMVFLSIITFRSYFAMTMICAYLSFKASWKLLELGIKHKVCSEKSVAIACLFLPSTAFWCTGISKDTVVYICVIYAIVLLFQLYEKSKKDNFFYLKLIVIYFLLSNIRDFMLIAALAPFLFSLGIRWGNKQKNAGSKILINIMMIGVILVGLSVFFSSSKAQEFSQEAQLIQTDLKNNTTYQGARYDLGVTDFSPVGMIKAMPLSILTAFYRPFIWEANTIFIFISAVETLTLLVLTIILISKTGLVIAIKRIQEEEFLIMAFVFSIILGFFAGYTSGLFGVLVRFKAPLLPFLYIVLQMYTTKPVEQTTSKIAT